MEQRPIEGAEPLAPPTAEVAQAYLEELGRVRARREERIDRRALAVFSLTSAVVLSVYVTIAAFAIGVPQLNSSFIVLVVLFLLWVQLGSEYREGHGAYGSPLSRSRSVSIGFAAVLIVVVLASFFISAIGVEPPVLARLIPGLLTLFIIGIPAAREIRQSQRSHAVADPRRLKGSERWATIGIGAVMAASVWVLAVGGMFLVPSFAMAVLVIYLAWWVVGRISERLPAPGAVWAWPQWSAFAISGAAVAAVIIAQLLEPPASLSALAPVIAVFTLGLFVGSAFLDGRDG